MTAAQRIRVPAGFIFAVIFLYFSQPQMDFLLAGFALAAVGLAFRIWAAGHIEKGRSLATRGPYQWTRNPLYFGSFMMGLGFTLAAAKVWLMGFFLSLFFALYIPVMRGEEKELAQTFGSQYEPYRRRVPLFVLRFKADPSVSDQTQMNAGCNFQWRRVILNREYHAVAGFVIMAVLLLAKMLWI